ncbi:hypothetical protein MML48_4g00001102 [Holotrichia oblita]|uniref:Uncharacterized protein n=1 Tax=Holotrichia oblita TaxID=644536 RepID=A0ACB9T771_HOLOL|nr:hypothetical protein MML48_4g00001102 [Holotrichia oblita]
MDAAEITPLDYEDFAREWVILTLITYTAAVDLQAVESQPTGRSLQTSKTINTLTGSQKPDQYYQQQIQAQQPQLQHVQLQQPYPVQYVPAPIYQQPHAQPAMIIIAQPTPIPSQSVISQAAQHLLNYFNANPQARYQFLQGNYQPQLQQQSYVPQPTAAPAYTYQVMPVQPQYQQLQGHQTQSSASFIPSPQVSSQAIPIHQHQQILQQTPQHSIQASNAQESYSQTPQFQLPTIGPFGYSTHIPHVAALAQLATQKYIPQVPLRPTTPAIITGLENFTPEQQAQIKAQLQSGGPITPLRSNLPPTFAANIQQNASGLKSVGSATQNANSQDYSEEDEVKTVTQPSVQQTSTNTYGSRVGYNDNNQFNKG